MTCTYVIVRLGARECFAFFSVSLRLRSATRQESGVWMRPTHRAKPRRQILPQPRKVPTLCKHKRDRKKCKDCGGGIFCEHQRRRSKCKSCNGSTAIAPFTCTSETEANVRPWRQQQLCVPAGAAPVQMTSQGQGHDSRMCHGKSRGEGKGRRAGGGVIRRHVPGASWGKGGRDGIDMYQGGE